MGCFKSWEKPDDKGTARVDCFFAILLSRLPADAQVPEAQDSISAASSKQITPVDSLSAAEELTSQRQFAPAGDLPLRLLPRVEEKYGPDSHEAGRVFDPLVMCLWQLGQSQTEETIALADRAIELKERLYGADS
ncbi:MAG: hypothetical protein KJ970_11805 [Candidatus Eisenbacteria bacterium]|uniref:Uncharacterized protein n=1 Tax=Eiseniibacteriota bacterium TaxID=2212470 RepID=A0A948RXY0_UNCEI|nr:hypothetical protein [Candidatus Eisenbacteria bacterium]